MVLSASQWGTHGPVPPCPPPRQLLCWARSFSLPARGFCTSCAKQTADNEPSHLHAKQKQRRKHQPLQTLVWAKPRLLLIKGWINQAAGLRGSMHFFFFFSIQAELAQSLGETWQVNAKIPHYLYPGTPSSREQATCVQPQNKGCGLPLERR